MRLTQKKTIEILVDIIGEAGTNLIEELIGKENVSEFDLAKRTKKDIKVVRKMLYMLYNHNLVGFTRKKDKPKGWYIYYWTLLPESIKFSYFKTKRDLLERLKAQLDAEQEELFFVCPNDCVRLTFDQGMDFEFHCPECGELIHQDDGEKRKADLQKKIAKLEEEVKTLLEHRKARRKRIKEKKEVVKAKSKVATRKKAVKKPAKKKVVKKAATKKKSSAKKKEVKKVTKKKTAVKKKAAVKKKVVASRKKAAKKPAKKVAKKKATKKKK